MDQSQDDRIARVLAEAESGFDTGRFYVPANVAYLAERQRWGREPAEPCKEDSRHGRCAA